MNDDAKNELPPGWVRTSVGDVFDVVGGGTPSTTRPEFWDGAIPWITSADIDEQHHVTPRRAITEPAIANSATNLVPPNSVVVVTRVGLGKVGLATEALCFSQDSQALLFDPQVINPWYVIFHMGQAVSIFRHIGRGTTISGVTKRQLLDLPFSLPPFPEQRRIVAELEEQFTRLDAAVGALKRADANLKRYRASVLKAACEGRLVPTEAELARAENRSYEPADQLLARILKERQDRWEAEQLAKMQAAGKVPGHDKRKAKYNEPSGADTSNLPKLPEGWSWAVSDALFSFVTSGSRGWAKYYSPTGALFLRMGNLDHDSISLDLSDVQRVTPPKGTEGTRTRVLPGDILISITADVGMVALAPEGLEESYINQHVCLTRLVDGVCRAYIAWYLSSEPAQHRFTDLQRGATKLGLGLDDIRSIRIPLPPLAEQRRIVAEVDRRLSVIDELETTVEANLKRAERLRQAILKRAFEGKLVPQEPNDEPASVLLERIRSERAAKQAAARPASKRTSTRRKAVAGQAGGRSQ